MIPTLSIDFETRSSVDLKRTGVYPYAQHPTTGIWCMAYAFDHDEVKIWKEGEPLPFEILGHILGGGIMRAWNAQFERVMWNECAHRLFGWPKVPLEFWRDTAVEAAAMGLPRSLADAAIALGVEHQKDAAGHRLMLQMCRPRRRGPGSQILWWDDPDKLSRLYEYCKQDVRTEQAITPYVRSLGSTEQRVYELDQRVNDRGIALDVELATAAKAAVEEEMRRQNALLHVVTNGEVDSVTRVGRLKAWLESRGVTADSLAKASVAELLSDESLPDDVIQVLQIRAETAKSSVAKIDAMLDCVCDDGRMRGLMLYHGAATGRWAGRLVQPQNFPRPTHDNIESYIPVVLNGDAVSLATVSSMLRSMLVASPEHDLIAADFNAIEPRVLAWLSNQQNLLEHFRSGGDPYVDMACHLYQCEPGAVTDDMRFMGKTIILGCGYQMGASRFSEHSGASLEASEHAVATYRRLFPAIVYFWRNVQQAATRAVREPGTTQTVGYVSYTMRGAHLWCVLPSKRMLCYPFARLKDKLTPWGSQQTVVEVSGMNSVTRRWERSDLYGGLLTENIVQAVARDLMAHAMLRIDDRYPVLLTVHDEIVSEVPKGPVHSVAEFERLMAEVPEWAKGCPVKAKGWRGERYRK